MKLCKKLIFPIVSIVAFSALAIGTTYALFTNTGKADIAVTAGKVKLHSEVKTDSFHVYSASIDQTSYIGDTIAGTEEINASDSRWEGSGQESFKATYYYERQVEEYSDSDGTGYYFSNHGHAAINTAKNYVTLSNMTPGDRVTFNIDVENQSNVDIKYRLRFALNEDPSLYTAEHTLADAQAFAVALKYNWGDKSYTKWHEWKKDSVIRTKTLWFDFELPILTDNSMQDKLAYFTFIVEGVQGNAYVSDDVEPMEIDKKVAEAGQPVNLETDTAVVNVPANAVAAGTELHLEVEPNVDGGYTLEKPTAGSSQSYEVNVVDQLGNKIVDIADPDAEFDVSIYLGVVELFKFYHYGDELTLVSSKAQISLTQAYYETDPTSSDFGWIFFKTKSFSPFSATYSYAGGINTLDYPYLVSNIDQILQINTTCIKNYQTKKSYFALINDIICPVNRCRYGSGVRSFIPNGMNLDFDGNGYMLTIESDASTSKYPYLFYQTQYCKLHDMDITINDQAIMLRAYNEATFENVDVYGYLNVSNNSGAYMIYCYYDATFISCDSYVDIRGHGSSGSYNAIYVGYSFDGPISFTDCHNKGSIICGKAVMFIGNMNNGYTLNVNITDCSNDGIIQWCDTVNSQGAYGHYNQILAGSGQCLDTVTVDGVAYQGQEAINAINIPTTGAGQNIWGPQDTQLAIEKSNDDTLVVTQAANENAVAYEVIINTYCGIDDGGSRQLAVSVRFPATSFVEGKYNCGLKPLNFVDQYWVAAHPDAVSGELAGIPIYTLAGVSYYYVNIKDGRFGGDGVGGYTSISVSCYDTNETPIATASLLAA